MVKRKVVKVTHQATQVCVSHAKRVAHAYRILEREATRRRPRYATGSCV